MVPGENKQIVAVQDMCAIAISEEFEPRALCIIRDMSAGQVSGQRIVLNLPASTSASQLMADVAARLRYEQDTFELVLPRITEKDVVNVEVHRHEKETLEELGFRFGNHLRNNLIIGNKNNMPPKKMNGPEDAATSEDPPEEGASYVPPPAPPPYTPEFNYSCNNTASTGTGFVGLVNQAMTCYLNSLLQTLFMTPEFRNTLYRWEFDGTEEDGTKSIPFQLQKLFLQLQTSPKPAVGTTDLTTSFGWDSSEAWQQHDVQELCRVMFDALEQKFKNTQQADLISRLYEGRLKDYVKCLECGNESAREDSFLDVPLVVRPFGSSQAYTSVSEALSAFVAPETLDGCNQYHCSVCGKKCDAHKGLKFVRFPYLLTLQMKRFDFDPATMHRIKLNDRVSFPEILTLNEFIQSENEVDAGGDEAAAATSTAKDEPDDDEGIEVESQGSEEDLCFNEKSLKKALQKGPYVYELFSIMVHSGSANGGHYYAYIKSFNTKEWYCFNDAQVSKITQEDIQKTYGGGPARGYYSSAYSSSTNAYMLMYRQIDSKKNADFVSLEDLPEHTQALLQCMLQQEQREQKQREMDKAMCKIKLFCQHPTKQRLIEMKLKVHKDCILQDATQTALAILGLEDLIPIECCRLVKYDEFSDSMECSFGGREQETMGDLLGGAKASYKFELFLEIRKPEEEFQEYKPGGTTVKVHVVNLDEEVSAQPTTIRCHPSNTVEELYAQIAQALGITGNKMRVVLETYHVEYKLLEIPHNTLHNEGFRKSNKVFVEFNDATDAALPYEESRLWRMMDCYAHTICVHINIPKMDKVNLANLDRLRLYDDVSDEDKYELSSEEEADENTDTLDARRTSRESACSTFRLPADKVIREPPFVPFRLPNKVIKEPLFAPFRPPNDLRDQDFDEGLGDSETGDSSVSQPLHSDPSEDSSLTDSERTLVGDDLSPRNNSPACGEPSPVSDVGRPECDSVLSGGCSSSPEEDRGRAAVGGRYFRAWPYTDYETGEKMLRVYVDKRTTLAELKKELESHIGVKADNFKIYRVYSNNQEFECTRLSDNLMSYGDDSMMAVKIGRALRKGEYKVKVYKLSINDPEPVKFLVEWVLVRGMTVLKAKKEVLPYIKETCGLDIPLNRCRLRKKSWKNPSSVFFDHQRFEKDIPVNTNWEMFLEVLPDAEPMTSPKHYVVFTRRYHPAAMRHDPFVEVVLEDPEVLLQKLHEISDIPLEFIEFAKGLGTFPCEISLLNGHQGLEWICPTTSQTFSPNLYITDDGIVIYYRDKREEPKKLSEEEMREISNKENVKIRSVNVQTRNQKGYASPRKEKALKIYTGESPPSRQTTVVPDLD